MKKIFVSFLGLFCCFAFLSCSDLINAFLEGFNKTSTEESLDPMTFDVDGTGTAYFVKFNESSVDPLRKGSTGSVTSTTSRPIEAEDDLNEEEDGITEIQVLHSGAYENLVEKERINKRNQDFIKSLPKNPGARAAGSISCETTKDTYKKGDTKKFYLLKSKYSNDDPSDSNSYKYDYQPKDPETAICMYSGEHCNVWFINNYDKLPRDFTQTDFDNLGNTFDKIYQYETAVVGSTIYDHKSSETWLNPKDKVQIILCDLNYDGYEGKTGGVFGYFYNADIYDTDEYTYTYTDDDGNKQTGSIKSNRDFIIYVDSQFYSYDGSVDVTYSDSNGKKYTEALNCTKQIYSTIAHEFNHLLNAIQKYVINGTSDMSTWYTEMLSMTMEDFLMEYMDIDGDSSSRGRLYYYFNNYYNYGPTKWSSGNDVYISYANAFAYGAFLSRNYGGAELIHEIATNDSVDQASIEAALTKLRYTDSFLDTIHKEPNVLINTTSTGITLNRSADNNGYENISITPINLKEHKSDLTYEQPKIYSKSTSGPKIYKYGFVINKVGTNLKTITYQPKYQDVLDLMGFEVIVY